MGRSVPTFRQIIEVFGAEWGPFRHALRMVDQDMFDALMNHARHHASAGHHLASSNPFEPIVMSMFIEHEKHLQKLQKKLEELLEAQYGRDDTL